MRVLFAGLFSFAAMLGAMGWLAERYPGERLPLWGTLIPGVTLLLALVVSMFLFNLRGLRPGLGRQSPQQRIAELEAKGDLLLQPFVATRAFGVAEFEDEGIHYFLELVDGKVLYLGGQYLYDYEPTNDDPKMNRPRAFPCTAFEVVRHRTAGYVLEIRCTGSVLEPELTAPPFSPRSYSALADLPEDGQVFDDVTYADMKARLIDS